METDEVLFQIETDKVTIDVRAPQSGTLEEILVCTLMQLCKMYYFIAHNSMLSPVVIQPVVR